MSDVNVVDEIVNFYNTCIATEYECHFLGNRQMIPSHPLTLPLPNIYANQFEKYNIHETHVVCSQLGTAHKRLNLPLGV